MQPGWRIVRLADRPAACDPLVRLMQTMWPDYYGKGGPGDAGADLMDRSRHSGLPYGIAACASDGGAIRTAALEKHSYGSKPDESPWLIGLLVAPEWRGQGIDGACCDAGNLRCRAWVSGALLHHRNRRWSFDAAGVAGDRGHGGWHKQHSDDRHYPVIKKAPSSEGACNGLQ